MRTQTLRTLTKKVSQRFESRIFKKTVRPVLQYLIEEVVKALEDGHSVRITPIGTLEWKVTKSRFGAREKLRFRPSKRYERGRNMEKYGVELDPEKTKEASKNKQPDEPATCTLCGKPLDSGGACPDHGTEPLEKKP